MKIIPSPFLCFFSTLILLTSHIIQASPSGFSVDLIHRDSQISPYYNASSTYYDNLRNSIRRSMTRYSRIFAQNSVSSPQTIQSPLTYERGDYLMKISVGTPPQDFLAIADTGSDLTWIQCNPCIACYNQSAPLFDPQKSSTYKSIPCQSKVCQQNPPLSCGDKNFCNYRVQYGDQSFSTGEFSLESFTFGTTSGKPVVLPEISFGCGHKNGGNFDQSTDGIVGLGNSDLSIVNQISDTINAKFSYCMVPLKDNVSSKISFGSDAIVSGSGVQTTPFIGDDNSFYHLNIESVSVVRANIKLEKKTYPSNANGNIIIDSGTSITYLPTDFYQEIEDAVKKFISSPPVEGESVLRLCYNNEVGIKEKVPTITFHFTGADWELGVLNTMVELEDGKLCFAMAPRDGPAIFGNFQQMNYLVGYDLNGKTLSFKQTDCSQQ